MIHKEKIKKLDAIIEDTLKSINDSKDEIDEIRLFAKDEYTEMYQEFLFLKNEASSIIERVDSLSIDLKRSKENLMKINKNYQQYTETEMKDIYEKTDQYRVSLAVEKEREKNVVRRRNELEIHLGSVKKIYEKAEKLSNDFNVAYSVLTGDFKQISDQMDGIQNKAIWGIKVLETQENERKRIARDMHDGPTQKLSNLILKTEVCIKLLDKDISRTRIELNSLKFLIRDIIDETRTLIHNLRPMSIDDLGLVITLERLVEEVKKELKGVIYLKTDININIKLDNIIIVTIYRICQEALNNIIKYSQATEVTISLMMEKDDLVLAIIDNGIGFELNDVKLKMEDNIGFGLSTMRERANLMMGDFRIESTMKVGTSIFVNIPINSRKEKVNDK